MLYDPMICTQRKGNSFSQTDTTFHEPLTTDSRSFSMNWDSEKQACVSTYDR